MRPPLTEADRAAHNTGRAHYHSGQSWETLPTGSHLMAGWIAAATEAADEARRLALAAGTQPDPWELPKPTP